MSEFEFIAEVFAPLTEGGPEAFDLLDDAAALPSRPGFDLVVTKDAMVEGVHFLGDADPFDAARRLLRCNLSDLAAKGAEPYGYFLAVAWPEGWDRTARVRFAAGLKADQDLYGLRLFGGDTVATRGPLVASVTALGWVEAGRMIRRAGAQPGDLLAVTGAIGDAGLGLRCLRGELQTLDPAARTFLEARHRFPEPRLEWRGALRRYAKACADVSDGLLADAGHLATPFGLGVEIDLDRAPLSPAAALWLASQVDPAAARADLATAGDDYELVIAASPGDLAALTEAAASFGGVLSVVGRFTERPGIFPLYAGRPFRVDRLGWTHA